MSKKLRFTLYPGLILLCSLLLYHILPYNCRVSDNKRYDRLTSILFAEEMKNNTLSMHYTISAPSDFGLAEYEVNLPAYHDTDYSMQLMSVENILAALQDSTLDQLSPDRHRQRELLIRYFTNQLALSAFRCYQEPLSPGSGTQTQLPVLLAEYTFRSVKDVEDYLALLSEAGTYLTSLLQYEEEKKAAGMLMAASSMDQVIEQCDTLITADALEENTHFLQTTFLNRLEILKTQGLINDEQFESYAAQNDRLLHSVLLPAYQSLADGLFLLRDRDTPLRGLACYPEGTDFYRALLISRTGSYRTPDEIHRLLTHKLEEEISALRQLLQAHSDISLCDPSLTVRYSPERTDMILKELKLAMKDCFPSEHLEELSVQVKSVVPCMEAYTAPAYYLTAPLDDWNHHVIYVNHSKTPAGLELYTTLAHEGFPGHLYQTAYHNRQMIDAPWRRAEELAWYGGFLEGWALYVEFLSYDQMSANHPDNVSIEIEKHSRSLQLCLYSLMDLMIHYDGCSKEAVQSYAASILPYSDASLDALYAYITEEPCNYLKYYLGYLEILDLKQLAMNLWTDYSDLKFHTFLLDHGPADFDTLHSELLDTAHSDASGIKSDVSPRRTHHLT